MLLSWLSFATFAACLVHGQSSSCPGYTLSNVVTSDTGLTALLNLAGPACNSYGIDLQNLTLLVEYQTGTYRPYLRSHSPLKASQRNVYMSRYQMSTTPSTKCLSRSSHLQRAQPPRHPVPNFDSPIRRTHLASLSRGQMAKSCLTQEVLRWFSKINILISGPHFLPIHIFMG